MQYQDLKLIGVASSKNEKLLLLLMSDTSERYSNSLSQDSSFILIFLHGIKVEADSMANLV